MPKIAFQKCCHHIHGVNHCTAKNKGIALKSSMASLLNRFITYLVFYKLKKNFIGISLSRIEISNFGSQKKKSKTRDGYFLERSISRTLAFFSNHAFYFQTVHSRSLRKFVVFLAKMVKYEWHLGL